MDIQLINNTIMIIGFILLIPFLYRVATLLIEFAAIRLVRKKTIQMQYVSDGEEKEITLHLDDGNKLVEDLLKVRKDIEKNN